MPFASPHGTHRFELGIYLALAYTLLIVYASLTPFSGWRMPRAELFSFLLTWPRYVTRFDVIVNVLAYIPLGYLIAVSCGGRVRAHQTVLAAAACGALLSLTMETLQMFVPGRFSSVPDILSNGAGSLAGALLARAIGRRPDIAGRLARLRNRLFLQGRITDWGLILLALWFLTQANPSSPLMGNWMLESVVPMHATQPVARFSMMEFVTVMLNTVALGLLASILLQPAHAAWEACLALLGAVFLIKWFAAELLLKPSAFSQWLGAEALIGAGYGLAMVFLFGYLRLRRQILVAACAILGGMGLAFIPSDPMPPAATLQLFKWSYGHLLNFNGLTRTVSELWPMLALAYLGALYKKI